MARVLGIGGIFFKAQDQAALVAWYRDVLGLDMMQRVIQCTLALQSELEISLYCAQRLLHQHVARHHQQREEAENNTHMLGESAGVCFVLSHAQVAWPMVCPPWTANIGGPWGSRPIRWRRGVP